MRHRIILLLAMFFIGFGVAETLGFLVTPKTPQSSFVFSSATIHIQPTIPTVSPRGETAVVSRVVDGDTIQLSTGEKVRYIGMDTPETVNPKKPVECFGPEASSQNKLLVEGKTVTLEKDVSQTDTYGRLLRYVYVGDVMINEELVRQGFAHASTYPPDIKYQDQLRVAEQEARENDRGLWKKCTDLLKSASITPEDSSSNVQGASTQAGCTIKGNISANGDKIYHIVGCGSYEKTSIDEARGEQWFCTEDDAVKAGWRKAKNC